MKATYVGMHKNLIGLVEGEVFRKGSTLRFKVEKNGKIRGFGLALKDVIAAKNY
jgi:hypothetical protein